MANAFKEMLGRLDSARLYYEEASRMATALPDHRNAGIANLNLSGLHHRSGQAGSAMQCARSAMRMSQVTDSDYLESQANLRLAEAFEGKLQFDSANARFGQYVALRDSIPNTETQEKVRQLGKKYQLAEKKRLLLKNEKDLNHKTATIQLQIFIIVVLVFILLYLWFQYKKAQQYNWAAEAMSLERTRIAVDLLPLRG